MGSKAVAIIGARLNSSRLPRKQLLPLSGGSVISHIVKRLQHVEALDDIVLATTADDYNADLVTWAKEAGVSVYAHTGDVNDLMGRVDAVATDTDADIIVYICGDSPLIEPDTINGLIETLRSHPKAGHARLPELPEGVHYIHEGFAVYSRDFWKSMMAVAEAPFEREHVGAVYHSLGKVETISAVYEGDDPVFHTINHRVSVDTMSDYKFMKKLYSEWYGSNGSDTLVDLKWVVERLRSDASLRAINGHVHQKQVREVSRKIVLFTEAGEKVGLGHLKRMTVAARQLQEHMGASVVLEVMGDEMPIEWLDTLPHRWHTGSYKSGTLQQALQDRQADYVFVDVQQFKPDLLKDVAALRRDAIQTIAVDCVPNADCFDAYYMPCFYVDETHRKRLGSRLTYGWSSYLLEPSGAKRIKSEHKKLLVLTGGSDFYKLGAVWPEALLEQVPSDIDITWVQGPYAEVPAFSNLPGSKRVHVLEGATDLPHVIAQHDYALCVYGVSFFECIREGTPTVAYAPTMKEEILSLMQDDVAILENDRLEAVTKLVGLIQNPALTQHYTKTSKAIWAETGGVPPLVTMLKSMEKEQAA